MDKNHTYDSVRGKLLAATLLLLFTVHTIHAQESHKIYFRVGYSMVDPSYMDNAHTLHVIDSLFVTNSISSLKIQGYASPEGGAALNQKLSDLRAQSVKDYFLKRHPEIASDQITSTGLGVNWSELREMVAESDIKQREQILNIIDNVPVSIINNTSRRKQLMDLGGGNPWRYMEKEFFPRLRQGKAMVEIVIPEPEPVIPRTEEAVMKEIVPVPDTCGTVVEIPVQPIMPEETIITPDRKRPFLMAIKTNMLYDVLLTPNLAVEFYLGRKWSIEGEFNYVWWKYDQTHFQRIEWGGFEVRRWIGNRYSSPLSGWFVGVYGLTGNYDIMYKSTGQKSSRTGTKSRENSGLHDLTSTVGIAGGYSLPVGKRLNLEFELGVGYLWGRYDTYEYDPKYNDYHYMETYKRSFWGPTKIEVSLSWLIGNARKGGLRR